MLASPSHHESSQFKIAWRFLDRVHPSLFKTFFLLVLPLAVPMLIFGAGMLDPSGRGAMKLLGAASLLLTVIGPFAAGAALKGLRE